MDRWGQCPRQWFGGYVEGDWAPQTDAQARGTAVDHEVQKHYRGEAVHPGWREAVDGIVKLLPPGVVIQQKIVTPTYEGGPVLVGYPDFLYEAAPGDVFVDDLKSTSDFRYAKTAEQLRAHIQPISYSAWLWTIPEVKRVRARHVTAKFDKDAKHPVGYRFRGARLSEPAEMDRDHVMAQWASLHDGVRAMVQAAKEAASFEDLPALGALDVDEFGKTGCERFGGCHFRARCGLDVLGGRKKTMSGMSLIDRLNAAKAAQANAANGTATQAVVSQPMVTKEGQSYVVVQPIPTQEQASTAAGYQPANPNHAHPGDVLPKDAGYKSGQPCNGNGHYASSNGQGFIPVEPGHACTVCEPGRVLPPDAPPRTSTSAESDAAEEKTKKRGRPKKAATDPAEMLRIYGELNEKRGFSLNEVERLMKDGAIEDALAGKITPGMLRQPAPAKAAPTPAPEPEQEKVPIVAGVALEPNKEAWYKNSGPPAASGQLTEHPAHTMVREQLVKEGREPLPTSTPPAQPVTIVNNHFTAAPNERAQAQVAEKAPAIEQIAKETEKAIGHQLDRVQEHIKALRKAPPKVPAVAPTIYVDCHPVKGPHKAGVVDAADWIGPIAELAALAHVDRDSGKPAPLDDVFLAPFGTGRAVLAAALRETLDSCPAVLCINSSSPAQQVALEVLTPHAASIVKGL